MTAELDSLLARQGLIWDNLYGLPASRRMVDEVRRLVGEGVEPSAAIAAVDAGDDGETDPDFVVPRHG